MKFQIGDVFKHKDSLRTYTIVRIDLGNYCLQYDAGRVRVDSVWFDKLVQNGTYIKQKKQMGTKVIIIGEQPKEEKVLKPITLHKRLQNDLQVYTVPNPLIAVSYRYIELVTRNYRGSGLDLMYCYNREDRSAGDLYIGNFNDGVV